MDIGDAELVLAAGSPRRPESLGGRLRSQQTWVGEEEKLSAHENVRGFSPFAGLAGSKDAKLDSWRVASGGRCHHKYFLSVFVTIGFVFRGGACINRDAIDPVGWAQEAFWSKNRGPIFAKRILNFNHAARRFSCG